MDDIKAYGKYIKAHAKKTNTALCCLKAFLFGGMICTTGEAFSDLYALLGVDDIKTRSALVSCTLILITAALTGIGVFDRIAKHAGAGTLVPVTGFANAMISQAIDAKSEGFIVGVAAKLFTVAGPVVVYGTLASVIYGIIYYIFKILFKTA
ncbi:MAG: SpoVA/SpoVAEb family sporulation membrane protein [Clostridia bacterium]|nr:SpoVA/SpoVAEb family sporulation membrane protein [Clostridia bacterium]